MFIPHGKRTARIKKYTENHQSCRHCGAFDLDVKVYNDYYHFCFIPIFPYENKVVKITCRNCGSTFRSDRLENHYYDITRTPIYFFTAPILFAALVVVLIFENSASQKEKAAFVDNPKVGDVYRIAKEERNATTYYFLRLVNVKGDTVIAYHSNLEYHQFTSSMNESDFFVKDSELLFLKPELQQMLDKGEINAVERNYDDEDGFNRIK